VPVPGRLLPRRRALPALALAALAALLAAVPAGVAEAVGAPLPQAPAATGPVVIRYDVAGRGNTGDLEAFAAAAAETYADPRGWAAGGAVRFERVASGGDFTLWLAADAQMATFGGACGFVWSCRSGRNVVINEDRWTGASPAWNETGASLRDYRHMVVNHETGHWLGLGHQTCAAVGTAAPVMQQQSMGLQSCTPNPWPLPADHARAEAGPRMRSGDARPPASSLPAPPHLPGAPGTAPAGAQAMAGERSALRIACRYLPWSRQPAACPH
jgi:hypothetical protein